MARFDDADDQHCPSCGAEFAWDGDCEESRVCGSCRAEEADVAFDHEADRSFWEALEAEGT